jgi:hypothetical protein
VPTFSREGKLEVARLLDLYTVRARLLPALIAALPLGIATLAWFPTGILGWGAVWALIVWSGGTVLLAEVGRDAGKRKEPGLFASWRGKPTTRLLRHHGAANRPLLARRHARLAALTGIVAPTAEAEAADPRAADETYEAWCTSLRDRTRDRKQFDLIFAENCSYGFRRNLWGMKPVGTVLAVAGLAAVAAVPWLDPSARAAPRIGAVVVTGAINALLLLGWLLVIRPAWVRGPAEAYAERLLEACERL